MFIVWLLPWRVMSVGQDSGRQDMTRPPAVRHSFAGTHCIPQEPQAAHLHLMPIIADHPGCIDLQNGLPWYRLAV